jgi:hypothetical protein
MINNKQETSTSTPMPWPPNILGQFPDTLWGPTTVGHITDFCTPSSPVTQTLWFFLLPGSFLRHASQPEQTFVMYGILLEDKPDLILELSPPGHLRYRSTCEAAVYNSLLRSTLVRLGDNCSFSGLNAVGTMGTRLCFHTKTAMGLLSLTSSSLP